MSALTLIVTDAGRAALVNAANTGTAPVTIASCGVSATAVAPTPQMTALPGESKRIATLSGDVVADDTIHLIVRDESTGQYTVRAFALYLADGTLFALYGQADPILEKSAQSMLLLALDVRFADVSAAQLTFGDANFLNPPATTEIQGVVELATTAEAQAGIDTLRALTPASAKAAILGWLLAQDGSGSGLDADLLDGQHGSYYTDIAGRLGFTPVRQGGGAGQGNNSIRIGWSGSRIKAQVDATDQGNFVFDSNIADVWRSSNDGSGSGMDADLLDGQDGGYYTNITARLGYTPANRAGDTFTGNVRISRAGSQEVRFDDGGNARWRLITTVAGSTANPFILQFSGDAFASHFVDVISATAIGAVSTPIQGLLWGAFNDGSGSGSDADLLDGYHADAFVKIGAINSSGAQTAFAMSGGSDDVWAGLQLREQGLVGNGNTAWANSPGLTFHWAGVIASAIRMTPDGNFRFRAQGADWNAFRHVYAANFYSYNTIVWSAGNDGAGSGMDADLLDGQHGGFYTDIPGRLGYTPVNKAGDEMAGSLRVNASNTTGGGLILSDDGDIVDLNDTYCSMRFSGGVRIFNANKGGSPVITLGSNGVIYANGGLSWTSTNDGSGSGLDADMLDGWDRDSVRDWNNLLNKPFNWSGQGGQPQWLWGSNDGNSYYVWNPSNFSVAYAANAGNADMLDGRHASDFMLANALASASFGASGYQVLPNGLILQWVTGAADAAGTEGAQIITFPISFPNNAFFAGAFTRIAAANNFVDAFYQSLPPSLSNVVVQRQKAANGADNIATTPMVIAIGN